MREVFYNIDMKLLRDHAKLDKMTDAEDGYVEASPAASRTAGTLSERLDYLENKSAVEYVVRPVLACLPQALDPAKCRSLPSRIPPLD